MVQPLPLLLTQKVSNENGGKTQILEVIKHGTEVRHVLGHSTQLCIMQLHPRNCSITGLRGVKLSCLLSVLSDLYRHFICVDLNRLLVLFAMISSHTSLTRLVWMQLPWYGSSCSGMEAGLPKS